MFKRLADSIRARNNSTDKMTALKIFDEVYSELSTWRDEINALRIEFEDKENRFTDFFNDLDSLEAIVTNLSDNVQIKYDDIRHLEQSVQNLRDKTEGIVQVIGYEGIELGTLAFLSMINTAHILDNAVTRPKIANLAVDNSKIENVSS
jgi:predicted  nucleic acid-binding Zn-ribbon protein